MLEIVLKVITIYTRRKSSPMMVSEQLGTLMRLIGPFVWVYLMARVHSGCFREIWVDCAQDGQVRQCDTKVFLLIKTRHVFFFLLFWHEQYLASDSYSEESSYKGLWLSLILYPLA